MKKTLLAAALLTGFAGAASAQSSVTLYGVIDMGIQYQNIKSKSIHYPIGSGVAGNNQTKTSMSQVGLTSGVQNGSRWGLKGVEDLGNGLKANFVYESGINATNGGSTGFTRQSTVGLSSTSWGALDLGRRTSPGTYAFSGIDPFGAAFGTAALDSSFGTQFIRYSNMVMYTTPNLNGFTGSVGYSFDTGLAGFAPNANTGTAAIGTAPFAYETNNKMRAVSVGLRYANGPLLLGAAFDQVNAPSSLNLNQDKVTSWMIGGTYDFKVVKVHAAYGQQNGGIIEGAGTFSSSQFGGDTNARGGVLFANGAKTQSWMVGLSAPVSGATNVFASVQQMLPGGTFDGPNVYTNNQTVASIGATYNLSKRTNLYGYYSYTDNYQMLRGVSTNTVTVGIRHRF